MARLSRAGQAVWREATSRAYETNDLAPIQEFLRVWGDKLPQWAQTQVRRDIYNIELFQRQEKERLAGPVQPFFVPSDVSLADALVEVAPGEFRTARVYVMEEMTYQDYLAAIGEIIDSWGLEYQKPGKDGLPFAARVLEALWRVK